MPVARLSAELEIRHRGRHAQLVLGGHVEGDPAARQLDDDSAAAMRWLVRPLDAYLHVDGGERAASPVTLTIGFQRLGWGEGVLLSPLDVDPKDLRTPGLTPAGRTTLSRLATRITFRHARHRLEITGVHEARFDLKPAPFDSFSVFRRPALDALGPAAEVALASDVRWRDTPRPFAAQSQQLFARYLLHAPRATLGLHAASVLDPLGVIELEGLDVTADPIRLPLQHRRHALIGASLAVPAGPVVLRAELAADVRRPIHVRGETPNAMPIERHEVYRGLLGGRWTTSHGGVLDVEATYARTTARADAPSVWPFAVPSLAARYVHTFLRERLSVEALGVATGRRLRGGAFARVEVGYRPHDALLVALGFGAYVDGPERSLLDGFGREDRLLLRVEGRLDPVSP
ncbi:MAG: hypothetical protein H6721_31105 [Sandaracinus sp.]|nr:hypothetical protein [Sandaracinus sp.]